MAVIGTKDKTIEIVDNGYLIDFDDCDENVSCTFAEREGIQELTKDKIDILKFTRQYYKDYFSCPIFGVVCLNVTRPKDCL
jgi:TusE/DsrC/DsvC family sulfur relay protein